MNYRKKIGNNGEELATNYLIANHYMIKERNYTTPYGEIDIIAFKNNCYYFCEVKTRTTNLYGKGLEAVSSYKIQRIKKVAEKYVMDLNWQGLLEILILSIDFNEKENDFFIEVLEFFH